MPTNDVRKMLADNMRCFDVVSDARGRYWLNGTLFGMDISARSEERIRCGMDRLADFIEPKPAESGGIDRDALLALAAQLDDLGVGRVIDREGSRYVARRIREALGVTADG